MTEVMSFFFYSCPAALGDPFTARCGILGAAYFAAAPWYRGIQIALLAALVCLALLPAFVLGFFS